ncbi:MAG: hypothetical protein QXP45_02070 [Thermoproteota archaeon]
MRFRAGFVVCLLYLAFFSTVVSQASPERTVELGPLVFGRVGEWVEFYPLAVVGDNMYVGGCNGTFEEYRWTLWKLDWRGNILSRKSGEDGCIYSLATDGSTIYAAGILGQEEFPYWLGFVAAFDPQCNMLWSDKWIDSQAYYSWFSEILVFGDYLYVVGVAAYEGDRGQDIVMLKYMKTGSLLWNKTWGGEGHQRSASIAAYGGRLYIVGATRPPGSTAEKYDGLLLVTDEDGNEVAHYVWGGSKEDRFSDVAVGSDLFIVGRTKSYGAGDFDGLLLRMNLSGNLAWWKTYGGVGYDGFYALIIDGDLIHVGGGASSSSMKPVYARYAVNGTLIDSKTVSVGLGNFTYWYDIYSKDGVTHLVGFSYSPDWEQSRGLWMSLITFYNLEIILPGASFWVSVDGESRAGARVVFEVSGAEHTLEAASTIEDGNTRYVFDRWSDGSTSNPRQVKLSRDASYTGIYRTEFLIEALTRYSTASTPGWVQSGATATISIGQTIVEYGNGTRRVFKGWYEDGSLVSSEQGFSITANGPRIFVAGWDTQYEVSVSTDYGAASGSGWYVAGGTATVSVSPTQGEKDFFTNYIFEGWLVDSNVASTSPTYSFIVTGPSSLTAKWRTELNLMRMGIVGGLALLIPVAVILLLRRRPTTPPPPPPPPPA